MIRFDLDRFVGIHFDAEVMVIYDEPIGDRLEEVRVKDIDRASDEWCMIQVEA